MNYLYTLTLDKWSKDNWQSEYKRWKVAYSKIDDKSSAHALGIQDQLQAIETIMEELEIAPH